MRLDQSKLSDLERYGSRSTTRAPLRPSTQRLVCRGLQRRPILSDQYAGPDYRKARSAFPTEVS
jgi:hypothetical protein